MKKVELDFGIFKAIVVKITALCHFMLTKTDKKIKLRKEKNRKSVNSQTLMYILKIMGY